MEEGFFWLLLSPVLQGCARQKLVSQLSMGEDLCFSYWSGSGLLWDVKGKASRMWQGNAVLCDRGRNPLGFG